MFDSSHVHEISISFGQSDYDAMIAAYVADGTKEWIEATVTIDGAGYITAGLRLKGNSSQRGLAEAGRRPTGGRVRATRRIRSARGRRAQSTEMSDDTQENDDNRVDREFRSLMEGLRTTLPGAQVLVAFLLVLPVQASFNVLTAAERAAYCVAFSTSVVASVLLIAPSVHQRMRSPVTGVTRDTASHGGRRRVPRSTSYRLSSGGGGRPLDPTGIAQALSLVDTLRGEDFSRILTSPLVRCHHSVAALAADRRVPVDTASWLRPDPDPANVELGLGLLNGRVLLCTHGECVKPILDVLVGDADLRRTLRKGEAVSLTWDDERTLATIRWFDQGP